jgi:hypothetical protein
VFDTQSGHVSFASGGSRLAADESALTIAELSGAGRPFGYKLATRR